MIISLIFAADSNHLIGVKNKLPWYLPADLKYFKKITIGNPVIMGRKTYESMGKPLPERRNIIITRNKKFNAEGCEVVGSINEAIDLCKATEADNPEIFIIGGAEVFKTALPLCCKIYLTHIHHKFEGDTHLPAIDFKKWRLLSLQPHKADEQNKFDYSFLVFER
jgi:dihydrofolate reductase